MSFKQTAGFALLSKHLQSIAVLKGELERPLCENCVAIPDRISALESRLDNLEPQQSRKQSDQPPNHTYLERQSMGPSPSDQPHTMGNQSRDYPQSSSQSREVHETGKK